MNKGFKSLICDDQVINSDYLFIHIRRSDFLEVKEFKELNFSDDVWIKSIIKVAKKDSLKNVVIFSDSNLGNSFTSSLKMYGIKIIFLSTGKNGNKFFLNLFVKYLQAAKSVICNASTLVIAISFLSREAIYLPSNKKGYQKLMLDKAHIKLPSCLNWK